MIAKGEALSAADPLVALVADQGVASHPYLRDPSAFNGADATRNLADAVHFLCVLHGRHPGMIDHAVEATACELSRHWLAVAAPAFSVERLYLTQLSVAAGPVPSTPGSAISEAAVTGQCHALRMLAQSERHGCPLGASIALVLDWRAIRPLLDHAATRLSVPSVSCRLPDAAAVALVAAELSDGPSVQRALRFGAEQVLVQHRGLFDLLEARRSARVDG